MGKDVGEIEGWASKGQKKNLDYVFKGDHENRK